VFTVDCAYETPFGGVLVRLGLLLAFLEKIDRDRLCEENIAIARVRVL
jgi:hypothetical protein